MFRHERVPTYRPSPTNFASVGVGKAILTYLRTGVCSGETSMNDRPVREPDEIRADCARKLQPIDVSPHFQAILGCLLGDWTEPRVVEMQITPDGHLLGRCEGQIRLDTFLGAAEDLIRNIHGVAAVASLDGDETGYLVASLAEIKRRA